MGCILADNTAYTNRTLSAGGDEAKRAFDAMMTMKR